MQFLRNMIVSGSPHNNALGEAVRKACAAVPDPALREALSQAVAEIMVGRELGQDVFSARANVLAMLDRIERANAAQPG